MKRVILILLLGCYCLTVSPQSNTRLDSLKQRLPLETTDTGTVTLFTRIAYELQFTDIDESALYAENALKEATRLNFRKGMAGALLQLANIDQIKGEYEASVQKNRRALELYEAIGDQSGSSIAYNNLGILAHNQSNYPEAFTLYRKSLEISRKTGRSSGIATSLFCLGTLHENLSGNDSALYYYLEGQKISELIRDVRLMAYANISIANIYFKMADYVRSMEYNILAVNLFESSGNQYGLLKTYISLGQTSILLDSLEKASWFYNAALKTGTILGSRADLAIIHHSLGQVHELSGQPDSAEWCYTRAKSLYSETGNLENYALVQISLAGLLSEKKRYAESAELLQDALATGTKINSPEVLMQANSELAGTYSAMSDHKRAFYHLSNYSNIKDSILTLEKQRQILELQTQYETEKKERENEILKKDQKILQTTRNSLIIGAIMLVTIVLIVLNNLSVKKRDNRLLRLQRDEIARQKELVEEHKTAIEDSIRYSKRIQAAMLPPGEQIESLLPDSFIIYLPRDIVSGDYYWIREISPSRTLVCAADCTGHGVPGALMSMLGMSLLSDIINTNIDGIRSNLFTPASILNSLRVRIKDSLRQTGKDGEARDGMDMTIAIIDRGERRLICSGANNPVYLINHATLTEIKSVRNPIGIHPNEIPFVDHETDITDGTMIYLFSDGFYDQINPDGKKFLSKNFKRLLEESSQLTTSEIKDKLTRSLHEWKMDEDQVDDILVIGIRL
jgi:serine phosphatase RsbU (regulator of sigma subunit)